MQLGPDLVVSVLTFAGAFCVVVAADSFFFDMSRRSRQINDSHARARQAERNRRRVREALAVGDLSRLAAQARQGKQQMSLRERLQSLIEQSDGATTMDRLVKMTGVSAVVGSAAMYLATGSVLISVACLILFASLPTLLLLRTRHRRREKLLRQLSDTFGLLSRVMRSGQSVTQAMEAVAEEMTPPVSQEFLYCAKRIQLGMDPSAALGKMAERIGLTELRIFALAVNVHRSCGGNLVTLIDLLEQLVRERFRVRGLVSSLTAQGRAQCAILIAVPIVIIVGMSLLAPDMITKLLEYRWIPYTAGGLMLIGFLWVRRICQIEL